MDKGLKIMNKKRPVKHHDEKFPLLRCPECGYTYRPAMHGWAFRTDKKTKCIGIDADEKQYVGGHGFHHPFKTVEE